MTRRRYAVTLSGEAERDLDNILLWTRERFGERQAEIYAATLQAAVEALTKTLTPPGAKEQSEIAPGYYSLHVARSRRRGRHLLLYREDGEGEIVIVRILYDGMDIARHLPSNDK